MAAARQTGQNPEFVLRNFRGMNTLNSRDTIEDDELWWCENAIPVSSGSLYPVHQSTPIVTNMAGETQPPTYNMSFSVGRNNYVFSVFSNTGNGYVINTGSGLVTKILTGLTSGLTSATQYSNLGILIVDPTGYWDWGVTTVNTLTVQNNSVASVTLVNKITISNAQQAAGTYNQLKQVLTTSGTGATFQTLYQVAALTIATGGTNYSIGDILQLTDGSPSTPCSILVTTVGGGGVITGISISASGSYPGPTSSTVVNVGPNGTVVTGGTGTGATFFVTLQAISVKITGTGTGYSNSDTLMDETSGALVIDSWTIASSGVISGTSIATYAGRVWIALGRVIFFTDINSYTSFGGAGGSFTINDSYLVNTITALFSANNYLYIFGDSSVDALSNVTITSGVTSFSRINVTASLGTSFPTSVFSYYRGIVFFNSSGIYLLAGASPEKISEKITGIVNQYTGGTVYGCSVLVNNELCAAMQFTIFDVFTQGGTIRMITVLYFRGRWWVHSFSFAGATASIVSLPVNTGSKRGIQTAWAWGGVASANLNQLFFISGPLASWIVKTKLWDGSAALREKQSLNAAFGAFFNGLGTSGVTVTLDTELSSTTSSVVPVTGSPNGYQLAVEALNGGGSQYLGLTYSGSQDVSQINLIALRGKTERDFLQ